jgi:hypothetical protein
MTTAEDQNRTKGQAHVNTTVEDKTYPWLANIPLHKPVKLLLARDHGGGREIG